MPINGLLDVARRRGLVPELLDLRNSADTAGDPSRVVGYGAFAFHEPAEWNAWSAERGRVLLRIARESLAEALGLGHGGRRTATSPGCASRAPAS